MNMRRPFSILSPVLALVASVLVCGCPLTPRDGALPSGTSTEVTLTPLSGQFGYALSGPHGLSGTMTKESLDDPNWRLDARFHFATGGYQVGDPDAVIMESFPEQVRIVIPVSAPPPNAVVTQVITEVPVALLFSASNEATFTVLVQETVRQTP